MELLTKFVAERLLVSWFMWGYRCVFSYIHIQFGAKKFNFSIISFLSKHNKKNKVDFQYLCLIRSPACWENKAIFTLSSPLWCERMYGDGTGCPVYGGNRSACRRMWLQPDVSPSWYHHPLFYPSSGTGALPCQHEGFKGSIFIYSNGLWLLVWGIYF